MHIHSEYSSVKASLQRCNWGPNNTPFPSSRMPGSVQMLHRSAGRRRNSVTATQEFTVLLPAATRCRCGGNRLSLRRGWPTPVEVEPLRDRSELAGDRLHGLLPNDAAEHGRHRVELCATRRRKLRQHLLAGLCLLLFGLHNNRPMRADHTQLERSCKCSSCRYMGSRHVVYAI